MKFLNERLILLNESSLISDIDKQIAFYSKSNPVNDYERGCNDGAIAALNHLKDSLCKHRTN